MRDLLDYQADQIERVLGSHGVSVRVYGGAVTPRMVEFHLAPAAGVKIARIEALSEELALSLGVKSCRVERRGSVVTVEVPKDRPPIVGLIRLMSAMGETVPAVSAVLGQDNQGLPIVLRLPSPDVAHVLITGTTGSGKTELAKSMILSLALCNPPQALRLLLIDPKGRGYRLFNGLPHLICPVVTDGNEAAHRLDGLLDEMERRDEAGECEPRIIVFVDEMADLMMVSGKQMVQTVTRLAQRGREAGIHLVASTQKPTAAIVGGLAKSNFPARLVGSVASADDARIAAGVAGSGAERLTGRGDFLLVVKGQIQRLQAAYVAPAEVEVAVTQLARQFRRPAGGERAGAPRSDGNQPTLARPADAAIGGVLAQATPENSHEPAHPASEVDDQPPAVAATSGNARFSAAVKAPASDGATASFVTRQINAYLRLISRQGS